MSRTCTCACCVATRACCRYEGAPSGPLRMRVPILLGFFVASLTDSSPVGGTLRLAWPASFGTAHHVPLYRRRPRLLPNPWLARDGGASSWTRVAKCATDTRARTAGTRRRLERRRGCKGGLDAVYTCLRSRGTHPPNTPRPRQGATPWQKLFKWARQLDLASGVGPAPQHFRSSPDRVPFPSKSSRVEAEPARPTHWRLGRVDLPSRVAKSAKSSCQVELASPL